MFTCLKKDLKTILAVPLLALFLLSTQGAAAGALAASDTWEVWPPRKTEPGKTSTPRESAGREGEAAGSAVFGGFFSGTTGRTVLIVGGVVILGAALLGGGGGGGGGTSTLSH
jgi:hypothetical protein